MFGLSDYLQAVAGPVDQPYPYVYGAHYHDSEFLGSMWGPTLRHSFDVLIPYAYSLDVNGSVLFVNDTNRQKLYHLTIRPVRDNMTKSVEAMADYTIADNGSLIVTHCEPGMWSKTPNSRSIVAEAVDIMTERRMNVNPFWTFDVAMMAAEQWRETP